MPIGACPPPARPPTARGRPTPAVRAFARADPDRGEPPHPRPRAWPLPHRRPTPSPPRTGCRQVARAPAKHVTGSPSSTATAGSARLPMITGWTNSTATWRACSGHSGARHHIVAPEANRRASARAAPARSAPASDPRPLAIAGWSVIAPSSAMRSRAFADCTPERRTGVSGSTVTRDRRELGVAVPQPQT